MKTQINKAIKILSYTAERKVTVTCSDAGAEILKGLLEYIAENGNGGHSFEIVVDPESDKQETFFWDGDGGDSIGEVTIEEIED